MARLRLTINRRGRNLAEQQRQIQAEAKRQLQQLQQSSAESIDNPPAEPAVTIALQWHKECKHLAPHNCNRSATIQAVI